jgi:hypothetical protein
MIFFYPDRHLLPVFKRSVIGSIGSVSGKPIPTSHISVWIRAHQTGMLAVIKAWLLSKNPQKHGGFQSTAVPVSDLKQICDHVSN